MNRPTIFVGTNRSPKIFDSVQYLIQNYKLFLECHSNTLYDVQSDRVVILRCPNLHCIGHTYGWSSSSITSWNARTRCARKSTRHKLGAPGNLPVHRSILAQPSFRLHQPELLMKAQVQRCEKSYLRRLWATQDPRRTCSGNPYKNTMTCKLSSPSSAPYRAHSSLSCRWQNKWDTHSSRKSLVADNNSGRDLEYSGPLLRMVPLLLFPWQVHRKKSWLIFLPTSGSSDSFPTSWPSPSPTLSPWCSWVGAAIIEITEVIICGWAMEALLHHAHQMSRLCHPHDGLLVRTLHANQRSQNGNTN